MSQHGGGAIWEIAKNVEGFMHGSVWLWPHGLYHLIELGVGGIGYDMVPAEVQV